MGILISFCCIFTLVTVLAMIIEPSRFRNGILILFCIAFWCLALVGHFFKILILDNFSYCNLNNDGSYLLWTNNIIFIY